MDKQFLKNSKDIREYLKILERVSRYAPIYRKKYKEEKDYAVDIDALRQEVLMAFEQELSLRKIRSFDESNNQDLWW